MQAQDGLAGHQRDRQPDRRPRRAVRDEGVASRLRGIGTSTLAILGPGSQLIAYNEPKAAAVARGADAAAVATHIGCALASAVVGGVRQSGGRRAQRLQRAGRRPYASGVDAAQRTEGPLAFYKGSVTHFLRLGPHMVLVFGILEQLRLRGR